jgi:hypothetical protein
MKLSIKQGKEIASLINTLDVATYMISVNLEGKDYTTERHNSWRDSYDYAVDKLLAMNIPVKHYPKG